MSHDVRPKSGNVSHLLDSKDLEIQEITRFCYGYNDWQTSHDMRSNTLAVW